MSYFHFAAILALTRTLKGCHGNFVISYAKNDENLCQNLRSNSPSMILVSAIPEKPHNNNNNNNNNYNNYYYY